MGFVFQRDDPMHCDCVSGCPMHGSFFFVLCTAHGVDGCRVYYEVEREGWVWLVIGDYLTALNFFRLILGVMYSSRGGSAKQRAVDRYFLFESGRTVTTVASSSSCSTSFMAPITLAPEEIPTARPSVWQSACAMRMASPSQTSTTGSSSSRFTIEGMNSSDIP